MNGPMNGPMNGLMDQISLRLSKFSKRVPPLESPPYVSGRDRFKRATVVAEKELVKVKPPWHIDRSIFAPRKAESDAKVGGGGPSRARFVPWIEKRRAV